jgi:hypothetical protein
MAWCGCGWLSVGMYKHMKGFDLRDTHELRKRVGKRRVVSKKNPTPIDEKQDLLLILPGIDSTFLWVHHFLVFPLFICAVLVYIFLI